MADMVDTLPGMWNGRADAPSWSWLGEGVTTHFGPLEELAALLPTFERRPFAVHMPPRTQQVAPAEREATQLPMFEVPRGDENRLYDAIIRRPPRSDAPEVPVGIVSKSYALVQHRDVVSALVAALKRVGIDLEGTTAELAMTEYGTRMAFRLPLPGHFIFDPGDGKPITLRLECLNSVDGSTRLTVSVSWFRLVCSNGLMVREAIFDVRRRHDDRLYLEDVPAAISQRLEDAWEERYALIRWRSVRVNEARLIRWIDDPLRKRWGVKAAARAFHIAITGHDGVFVDPFEGGPPHQKTMRDGPEVPGVIPRAADAYAISQILAWLAKERRDIQGQVDGQREITFLVEELLRSE